MNSGASDLYFKRPTAAKKQQENHVQVGQKCNIEDMRRSKNNHPITTEKITKTKGSGAKILETKFYAVINANSKSTKNPAN